MPSLASLRPGGMMSDRGSKSTGNVAKLQEAIHNLLNDQEQAEFREIINDYHSRKNLTDFCHSLGILLDTPAKKQISKFIRRIIRKGDVLRFDELMSQAVSTRCKVPNGVVAQWETKSLPQRIPGQYATLGRQPRAAPSVVSAPAYHYGTLPHRVIKRPMAHTDFLGAGRSSVPEWEVRTAQVKHIHLEQPANPGIGLGFSIRGGAEHGIGIYVSYVDVGSIAEKQGLAPGDQILVVNGVSFKKITHSHAAKIVQECQRIDLEVRHVGRVPGSFETHQTYTWVDGMGRTVSPPPEVERSGRYKTAEGRKSGLMLLKDSDERKVNLVVSESKTLGIAIRGGNEFGLGIYITKVDRGSVAENSGLKVGDQILDVNGKTFLDIAHADTVKVLKSSRHLMITVKDVGKLPYARTTYDHTKWISGDKFHEDHMPARPHDTRSDTRSVMDGFSAYHPADSMFSRGAGSQLMHNSMMPHKTQMALIEESAQQVLTERQHSTLKYYLEEYQKGSIHVEALLLALFELLTTRTKFALMTDIRSIIHPKDIKAFDHIVLRKEVTLLKSKSMEALYPLPADHDDYDESLAVTSSERFGWPTRPTHHTTQASEEEMEALRQAIELIEHDRIQDAKETKRRNRLKIGLGSLRGKKKFQAETKVEVEVHRPANAGTGKDEMRSPSEDSGVELNGHMMQNTDVKQRLTQSSRQQTIPDMSDSMNSYHNKYMSLRGKNAYSLMDTSIPGASDDPDASTSDLDESIHRRLDMFKMLPAQFESEMVHANIQTEEAWLHSASQYEGNGQNRQWSRSHSVDGEDNTKGKHSRVLYRNGGHSFDYPHQMSPGSDLLEAPAQWNDASPNSVSVEVHKPPKPPRSQKSKTHPSHDQQSPKHIPFRISNIPDISLDHPQTSSPLSSTSNHGNHPQTNPLAVDPRLTEPLSIVPPLSPTEPTDLSPKENNASYQYKLYDIPFDDADLAYAAAPPSETSLQLSPIAIVPPPPPMDSPLSLTQNDLWDDVTGSSQHDQQAAQKRADPSHREIPEGTVVVSRGRDTKLVTVQKVRPTLGLAIEGGANTRQPLPRIINIQPDGAASLCQNLVIGDVIAEVNGQPLTGQQHRQCAKIIATAFKDKRTETLVLTIVKEKKMKL